MHDDNSESEIKKEQESHVNMTQGNALILLIRTATL